MGRQFAHLMPARRPVLVIAAAANTIYECPVCHALTVEYAYGEHLGFHDPDLDADALQTEFDLVQREHREAAKAKARVKKSGRG